MSSFYYLTLECDATGCFVLHTKNCEKLPDRTLRIFIGTFYHPRDAYLTAKYQRPNTRYCKQCLGESNGGKDKLSKLLKA